MPKPRVELAETLSFLTTQLNDGDVKVFEELKKLNRSKNDGILFLYYKRQRPMGSDLV